MRMTLAAWLRLSLVFSAAMAASPVLAQSTEAPGAATTEQPAQASAGSEWPCEQPLRGDLSIGAVWSGPDPQQTDWRKTPAIAALVGQIAPRHTAQDEAVASIHRFAAGYEGDARAQALTALFGGLFETLSHE